MMNICISIYIEYTGTGYVIKLSSNSYDGVATFFISSTYFVSYYDTSRS